MDDVVADLERYHAAWEAASASGSLPLPEHADDEFASIFLRPELSEPQAAEASRQPEAKPVPSKTLLCVEAQTEIQDALRKQLSHMGYRVMIVSDAERAAERFRESMADAVIFDTDGQDAESIEAFLDMHSKAHEEEQQLVALVLLGPRQEALREKLPADDQLIVLSKPIKMKQVQDAISHLVPLK
jgi:CheY-like chemotaxis protein